MALGADEIADLVALHIRTDGNDLAHEFVADGGTRLDCLLRPGIPIVDVAIRPADASFQHFDQDIVDAVFGLGNILEPDAFRRLRFHESLHGGPAREWMKSQSAT